MPSHARLCAAPLGAFLLCSFASAQITHTGRFAGGVAYDAVTDEVIVFDETSDIINFYDRATGAMNLSLPAPRPLGITNSQPIGGHVDIATGNIWVADENEIFYSMDRAGNVLTAFSTRPAVTDVSALTFDPCTRTIWISNDSANTVTEFDPVTGAPTGNSFTPQGSVDGDGITYNPVSRTFLMGEDTGDQILEVDRSGTLLNTYPVGPISPEGLALDTVTGTVFVANGFVTPIGVFQVPGIVTAAPTGAVAKYGTACGNTSVAVSDWVRDDGQTCAGFQIGYQSAAAPGGQVLVMVGRSRMAIPLSFLGSNCTAYALGDLASAIVTTSPNARAGVTFAIPPGAAGLTVDFWFGDIDISAPGIVQGGSQGLELQIQ